jgi:oligo-1,6-glucosidase
MATSGRHGDAPWWRDAVVYQIYPRSFCDADGDGVGDLRGITSRLDHLVALGVDVVWLSPVYRSPHDDNGYDISDYHDVDPTFGTLADLDELTAAIHDRGMRLVMDLVVNHTSDEHPWFVESRSSTTNPRRDWYWWRPPAPDGGPPNNWGSIFSGPAWELDETTGEYYLHLFSRKQPDLNWEHPDVRAEVHRMMRWWLDRGIDGFRMDVINMISKAVDPDGSLPDGTVHDGHRHGSIDRHAINGPRLHEFLQEMHREVFRDHDRRLLLVGETPGARVADAALLTDPERAELDMVFHFEHVSLDRGTTKWDHRPLDLVRWKRIFARWQDGLAERGWNSLYLANHDQPRSVSRFGDDREYRTRSAKTLATMLHLQRGTPYIYQGEELAMANTEFRTIDDVRDVESLNHWHDSIAPDGESDGEHRRSEVLDAIRRVGRDNARTPMQWDATEHAGFTSGTPWLRVNPDHTSVNAAAAIADPDAVFHHYRRLIALRHADRLVSHGACRIDLVDHTQAIAVVRTAAARPGGDTDPEAIDADVVIALANLTGTPAAVEVDSVPELATCTVADADLTVGEIALDPAVIELGPWSSVVLRPAR